MDTCSKILGSIAITWISVQILKFLLFVYTYMRPSSILRYHHNHSNSSAPPWAIVTGATDGIGKGYAYELADRGFNVVLHGRNSAKLHSVRHALQNDYPHLSFRIILADASKSGPESLKHIKDIVESLTDLHVTILINNVGSGSKPSGAEVAEAFDQTAPDDIDALINLNARFPVQFTRAVLPLLLSHGGPALIITMGSMAEVGIPVSWDKTSKSLFRPTSREFARAALSRVGCGKDVVAAWWTHGIAWAAIDVLPAWILDRALAFGAVKTRKWLAKSS